MNLDKYRTLRATAVVSSALAAFFFLVIVFSAPDAPGTCNQSGSCAVHRATVDTSTVAPRTDTLRVLSIFGTRPEGVKMAPVVKELEARAGVDSVVCVTAQHREMLDQILDWFDVQPDIDLNLMSKGQTLTEFTARAMVALSEVMEDVQPDVVLVQGDTTTAMVAGLVAHYRKVAVGHVEAGLRTYDRYSPFPEELNRVILSDLALYHFAPTAGSASSLQREGFSHNVHITGNPVVDALEYTRSRPPSDLAQQILMDLGIVNGQGRYRTVLVTAHRRENHGDRLINFCNAIKSIVASHDDVQVVYPVHLNPKVMVPVHEQLDGVDRVQLIAPLSYEPFVRLMDASYIILTDSGGIQEEAVAMGTPVLVMREDTERPEGVDAGIAKLVGTDMDNIVREAVRLLDDERAYRAMTKTSKVYGAGDAAKRIVDAVVNDWANRDAEAHTPMGPGPAPASEAAAAAVEEAGEGIRGVPEEAQHAGTEGTPGGE